MIYKSELTLKSFRKLRGLNEHYTGKCNYMTNVKLCQVQFYAVVGRLPVRKNTGRRYFRRTLKRSAAGKLQLLNIDL